MVKIFLSTKFIKIGPRAYVELSCVQTDTLATFPTPRKAHMASLSLSRAVIVDTENTFMSHFLFNIIDECIFEISRAF